MNIEEERQDIIQNNNTAQERFANIIEQLVPAETREIHVSEALIGDIDLAILIEQGFTRIKNIQFSAGKITSISHIPETVTRLFCANNMIAVLADLPVSLTELYVNANHIATIDLTEVPNLKILNISENDLAELTDLPESLLKLYCSDNHIAQLDLETAQRIDVLHCSNNKLMVLQNVPKSLRDLKMENNPMAEIKAFAKTAIQRKEDVANKITYVESIQEYFRLKSKYDMKAKQLKHNAFESAKSKHKGRQKVLAVKPPCINCKRKVATIWAKRGQTYSAMCGDRAAPCNLHIEIYSATFFHLEDLMAVYRQEIEQYKQSIIQQKMDTLFSYISETRSATEFKKKMDEYMAYSAMYKKLMEQYDDLYNNMYKKEQLRKTMEEMYAILTSIQEMLGEYQKTGTYSVLEMAITTYKDELLLKIENARRLQNEVVEMDIVEFIPNSKIMRNTLVKCEYPLSMIEYLMSEPPSVLHFTNQE